MIGCYSGGGGEIAMVRHPENPCNNCDDNASRVGRRAF